MTLTLYIRILLFIAFFTSVSFAQVKTLTEAEYDAATNAAYDTTSKKIRRSTSINQSFEGGKIKESSTEIEEYLSPDRQRLLYLDRDGSESSRTEVITIGNDVYEKYNSDKWKKPKKDDTQTYTVKGNPEGISKITVKYTAADSRLNGETVRVLSKLQKNLSSFENTLYNLNAGEELNVMWIRKNGLIMKTERTVTNADTKKIVDKTVETYDYQPKGIKIVAPIK
jgi:hypothetical protein